MTMEEFEAIRLKDYLKIKQQNAAEIMENLQPTLHRILISAREKVANALVEGKILNIKGGDYIQLKKDINVENVDLNGKVLKKNMKNVQIVNLKTYTPLITRNKRKKRWDNRE